MYRNIRSGKKAIRISLKAFVKYPQLIIPLFVVWLIYAPTILYFKYEFAWEEFTFVQQLLIGYLITFCFAFLLSVSCLVVLEVIQQIETNNDINFFLAIRDALFTDLLKTLPIILIWSTIWFLLSILQFLLARKRENSNDYSAEEAAKTLAGVRNISFSAAFIEAIKKGIRMIVFLMLPSIAWENKNSFGAIKKGINILKNNRKTFVVGFVMSEAVDFIVFLPSFIIFYLSAKLKIHFADWVWYLTIVYTSFAWSFSILIEQLFTAELYLWHLVWEEKNKSSESFVEIEKVRCPSLINNKPELLDVSS